MLADSHIHSFFSPDSSASIEEIALQARERGMDVFTISDHYEIWDDEGYTFDVGERCAFLVEKQKIYPGLLIGVEIGEVQHRPAVLHEWERWPFDLFLGSIHVAGDVFGPHASLAVPDEEVYRGYFAEVKRMVETTTIDAVAHMDFPRRYLGSYWIPWDMVEEILDIIIEKNIAIEINTSLWRKGLDYPLPDEAILARYAEKGGRRVILGSDAHQAQDVGAGVAKAAELARRLALVPGYYRHHHFVPLEG